MERRESTEHAEHRPERGRDPTFKRHGPPPPENDSGPSADGNDEGDPQEPDIRNVEPDQGIG